MRAKRYQRAILLAALATMLGSAPPTDATTITFDDVISQPAGAVPPVDIGPGLALDYETPWVPPGPPDAFYTQGFAFGGRTEGVTVASTTRPGFGILIDPTVCLGFGTACADNGTRFLAFDIAASLVREDFSQFSISSFSASQAFDNDAACPECNEGIGLQNAALVRASGFNLGALVAQETFELSFSFETFMLVDADWSLVDRVVFQPLDTAGNPGTADVNPCCTLALDDIQTQTPEVPEPATALLLGVGLVGLVTRRMRCGNVGTS